MDTRVYDEVARILREGGRAALATVIGTRGSTPGKTSMKMLVYPDGTALGSVGGGCVEAEVIERGREVARTEQSQRFEVDLNERDNPETGLICGGRVEILIEPIVMPELFLFGAGHVGQAVCEHAARVGFRVVVVDDRDELVTEARFPLAAERVALPWSEALDGLRIGPDAYVAIMTRGHKDDLAVLLELARRKLAPRYLGLIGSRAKHRTLRGHLEREGVDPSFMDRVRTPIGLPIGAVSAHEIAISLVAELIALRRGAGAPGAQPT